MNIRAFFKAVAIKSKRSLKFRKKLVRSYVSLFLVIFLLIGTTVAWFTTKDSTVINTQKFQMTGPDAIRNSQLQTNQTKIVIPNFNLEEASSVDGRNIYFPATFTNNVSDDNNSTMITQTKNMVFREGNAGDKNKLYAYASTDINSSGSTTNVWVKGYKVKVGDDVYEDKLNFDYANDGITPVSQNFNESCPVRIAVIDDSGHKPKVFDPSARVKDNNFITNTDAIYSITTEGKATTQTTNLDSFSSYYYGTGNPLFTIDAGKKINLTVVAWLEGTHPRAAEYCGQNMYLELEIETNVSEMEYIYLHDWTVPDGQGDNITSANFVEAQTWNNGSGSHWLGGELLAMSYYDAVAKTDKTAIMNVDGEETIPLSNGRSVKTTVYKAAIPKYVLTNISFYRLNNNVAPSTAYNYPNHTEKVPHYGLVFNSWHTNSNVNDMLNPSIKNNDHWKVLGSLAVSRKIGLITYSHYFAIRGNNYGVVSDYDDNGNYINDSSKRPNYNESASHFSKWLSPCIGYWGTSSGPLGYSGSESGGESGGGGGESGGGGSSNITISLLKLDIPDAGTFTNNWYRNDVKSDGEYTVNAIFSNDGGTTTWRVPMTSTSDGSSVSLSNYTSTQFTSSTQLVGFIPVNKNNQSTKDKVNISYWTIQSNYNKVFQLKSSTSASG